MTAATFTTYRRHPGDYTDLLEAIAGDELPEGAPVVILHDGGTVFGTVAWTSADGEELTAIDVDRPSTRLKLRTSSIEVIHRFDRIGDRP